jgi:hypothetical protein
MRRMSGGESAGGGEERSSTRGEKSALELAARCAAAPVALVGDLAFRVVGMAVWALWQLACGACDACAVWRSATILRLSPCIFHVFSYCLVLNGVCLGGSALLVQHGLTPALLWVGGLSTDEEGWPRRVVEWAFALLWHWPLYLAASVLNAFWYQDIFSEIHRVATTPPRLTAARGRAGPGAGEAGGAPNGWAGSFGARFHRLVTTAAEEVLRILIVLGVTAGSSAPPAAAALLTPGVSAEDGRWWAAAALPAARAAGFCMLASVHAFHAFDYRWSAFPPQRTLHEKLRLLDGHLPYFVGYGSPLALVLVALPRFEAAALYATLFPLLVLQSHHARPPLWPPWSGTRAPRRPVAPWAVRWPLFAMFNALVSLSLLFLAKLRALCAPR